MFSSICFVLHALRISRISHLPQQAVTHSASDNTSFLTANLKRPKVSEYGSFQCLAPYALAIHFLGSNISSPVVASWISLWHLVGYSASGLKLLNVIPRVPIAEMVRSQSYARHVNTLVYSRHDISIYFADTAHLYKLSSIEITNPKSLGASFFVQIASAFRSGLVTT